MAMSDEAKAVQREYKRIWRKKNRERIAQYNENYWEKKAQHLQEARKNDSISENT